MTLKDVFNADVSSVFLDTDECAEVIARHPQGDTGSSDTMNVVIHAANLDGTREEPGDGRTIHNQEGTRIRESLLLEMSKANAATVTIPDGFTARPDQFEIYGRVYSAKRFIREDEYMATLLVIDNSAKSTKLQRPRG